VTARSAARPQDWDAPQAPSFKRRSEANSMKDMPRWPHTQQVATPSRSLPDNTGARIWVDSGYSHRIAAQPKWLFLHHQHLDAKISIFAMRR
jgi:hypothetical protein